MSRSVLLFDQDISEYVDEIPEVLLTAGEYGQLIVSTIPSITGINVDGFWSQRNQASPFYGAVALHGYPIKIVNDGQITFLGSILTISTDGGGKSATVNLRSALHDTIESGAVVASEEDGQTPSEIVAGILNAYNIPYDAGSFAAATAIYNADNVLLYAVQTFPDQTIQAIIQTIAEIGVARIALSGGLVRYDVYNPVSPPGPLYTFSDSTTNEDGCTLFAPAPSVETVQKDKTEGFYVEWVGTPPATLGSEFVARRTVSGPADSPVRILSFQAATWIGDRWLRYLQRPQQQIRFSVPVEIARQLDVGYAVAIEYSRWGSAMTVDIVSINASRKVAAEIVGLTR